MNNYKLLRSFFFLGVFVIASVTTGVLVTSEATFNFAYPIRVICYISCALCFLLLIHTLFFAIPFEAAYIKGSKQKICNTGVYSLCRHPGVLFLSGTYLFAGLATGRIEILWLCLVITFCNIFYVTIQDRYTFPVLFDNYSEYQESTPFLIPDFQRHEEK
ncbi:MAG: hypothetical protein JJE03_01300 [Peptostreptococcaceae bacterium]|nr:hypothetical protein [Peptostreptococcaceae bacterium]